MGQIKSHLVILLAGIIIGALGVWYYTSIGADDIRREADELRANLENANRLLGNLRDEYYRARDTIGRLEETNRSLEEGLDRLSTIYTGLDGQMDSDRQAIDGIRTGAQEGLGIIESIRESSNTTTP